MLIEKTVSAIHATPAQGVIAVTGCAPSLTTELLRHGGGSATVLDSIVPYHTKALIDFIKRTPKKFCSEEVALELASKAFSRATELEPDAPEPFGLGCTATLRKNGPEREGRVHQAFVSFQTQRETHNYHIVLNCEHRVLEEDLLSQALLKILCDRLGVEEYDNWEQIRCRGIVEWNHSHKVHDPQLQHLLAGTEKVAFFPSVKGMNDEHEYDEQPPVLLSGSFNPAHDGHRRMARTAYDYFLGHRPIHLELSLANVDKGKLSAFEIQRRLDALINDPYATWNGIFVTNAPTFLEKAKLLLGATFVVGIDTWYRLNDSKYCGYSTKECQRKLDKINELGSCFLVFGRYINGSYHTLPTTEETNGLAVGIPEKDFRADISSSQIRAQG